MVLSAIKSTKGRGKKYASKEILWSRSQTFYLPKASPLLVRLTKIYKLLFKTQNALFSKEDLNRAVAWWLNTGINQKMETDVEPIAESNEVAFWTRPKIRDNNPPLTIWHVIPSFMLLGAALVLSTMIFAIEMKARSIGQSFKSCYGFFTGTKHADNERWAMPVPRT